MTFARLYALLSYVEEDAMSHTTSPLEHLTASDAYSWVEYLPEGAVSVAIEGATLVLRASMTLQERFETLLAKRKAGTLSPEEQREYEAICGLDTALSWLNRLARSAHSN
jgi:hypothetical protein